MTASLLAWHLTRDNHIQLARFCMKHAVRNDNTTYTRNDGEHDYFEHTYHFDNGGYVTAEMLHGDTRSYSIADRFQVIDYALDSSLTRRVGTA